MNKLCIDRRVRLSKCGVTLTNSVRLRRIRDYTRARCLHFIATKIIIIIPARARLFPRKFVARTAISTGSRPIIYGRGTKMRNVGGKGEMRSLARRIINIPRAFEERGRERERDRAPERPRLYRGRHGPRCPDGISEGLYAKIANYRSPAMKACDNASRSDEVARLPSRRVSRVTSRT